MQHPVDMYIEYLKNASIVSSDEFYSLFRFIGDTTIDNKKIESNDEYRFVGVILNCTNCEEYPGQIIQSNRDQEKIELLKRIDPSEFSWEFYYLPEEEFDEAEKEAEEEHLELFIEMDHNSYTIEDLDYNDQTILSIFDRLTTIATITKVRKAIQENEHRSLNILFYDLPYDLVGIRLYEDMDANSIPIYLCQLDLRFGFEDNSQECELILNAETLEELLKKSEEENTVHSDV